jgi:predicted RNA methylase
MESEHSAEGSVDRQFFEEYTDPRTHKSMVLDVDRVEAYRAAIEAECRGKVVLDVGCGTGLLSIMAAQAGATRVFAVEASGLARHAKTIVEANGWGDVIEVIHGRVEDVMLEQVDVLLCEVLVQNFPNRTHYIDMLTTFSFDSK